MEEEMEDIQYINNISDNSENKVSIIENDVKVQEPIPEFSPQILLVQQKLNQIKINPIPLQENGFYNDETKNTIIKLQSITLFEHNGEIDQNLMFRLNEIIENPIITEYNQNRTFAVLYSKFKEQG